MPKPEVADEKPYRPDWKYIGIGVVVGMLLLTLLIASGGRVEEWNFGILKVVIPTATNGSDPITSGSETAIESFPIKIFDYDGVGDEQVQQGWAKLAITFPDQKANYLFDYDLPSDGTPGYAGLAFRFEQTQDLSGYKSIRIVLDYFDDASQCEFFIKDISFQREYVLLGKNTPPGGSVKIIGTEHSYEIPLSNFSTLNIKAVYEIGFSVDTDITQGKHMITFKQITFIR